MIAFFQKSFKTKAFKIFMWVMLFTLGGVFSFIEIGRQYFSGSGAWVALVNGEKIAHADFVRHAQAHKERVDSLRSQYPEYAEMIMQQMGSRAHPAHAALDTLVRQKITSNVAHGALITAPTEDEIQNKLGDIQFVQQELSDIVPMYAYNPATGAFNMQLVRNHLHRMGLSLEDFYDRVSEAIIRNHAMKLAQLASYTPEFELKNQFVQGHLGKRFTVLNMNSDSFLKEVKNKSAAEEQLKSFFESNKELFRVPEKRSALVYSFSAPNYALDITDAQIKAQYEKNKSQYVSRPAQVEVRRILLKVENVEDKEVVRDKAVQVHSDLIAHPESFTRIAKEVSQDVDSAQKGGLLEAFSKGTHDSSFERAAFTLKEDGAVSSVVETKDGFEVIQRVRKIAQQYKPLTEVKKQIKDAIANQKFEKQFAHDMRTLFDGNQLEKEKLSAFAKKHGAAEKKHTDLVNNGFPLSSLVYKMNVGETQFESHETYGTVATLLGVTPTYIPEFTAVKDAVKQEYYQDQAKALLSKTLSKAEETAQAGKALDEFKKYGSLEQTGLMKKTDMIEMKRLERIGVPMQRALEMDHVGATLSQEIDDHAAKNMPSSFNIPKKYSGIVVRLEEIEPFDTNAFLEKKASLKTEQSKRTEPLVGNGFIASLYRNATINTNNELLQYQ